MQNSTLSLDERLSSALRHVQVNNRNLRFETRADRVILRGQVNSFYHKQIAQEALRRVEGVGEIENQLEVRSPDCVDRRHECAS